MTAATTPTTSQDKREEQQLTRSTSCTHNNSTTTTTTNCYCTTNCHYTTDWQQNTTNTIQLTLELLPLYTSLTTPNIFPSTTLTTHNILNFEQEYDIKNSHSHRLTPSIHLIPWIQLQRMDRNMLDDKNIAKQCDFTVKNNTNKTNNNKSIIHKYLHHIEEIIWHEIDNIEQEEWNNGLDIASLDHNHNKNIGKTASNRATTSKTRVTT